MHTTTTTSTSNINSTSNSSSASSSESDNFLRNVSLAMKEGNAFRQLVQLSIDTRLIPSKRLLISDTRLDSDITQALNSTTYLIIVTDTIFPNEHYQVQGISIAEIPVLRIESQRKLGVRGIVYPCVEGEGFYYGDTSGKHTLLNDYDLLWLERHKSLRVAPPYNLTIARKKRPLLEAYSSDFDDEKSDEAKESLKKRRRLVAMERRMEKLEEENSKQKGMIDGLKKELEACICYCWDCGASLSMDNHVMLDCGHPLCLKCWEKYELCPRNSRMRVICICKKNGCEKPIEKAEDATKEDSTPDPSDSVQTDTVTNQSLLSSTLGYFFGGSSSSSTTQTN